MSPEELTASKEYFKAWHAKNPGKKLEYEHAARARDPEGYRLKKNATARKNKKPRVPLTGEANEQNRVESLARYYANHEENKAAARRRAATPKGRLQSTAIKLAKNFGITIEQRDEMFAWQDNKCGCCIGDDPGCVKGWTVDHDHATGVLRGILCWVCNVKLGQLGDNATEVLRSCLLFLHYLGQSGDRPAPDMVEALRDWLKRLE